MNLCSRRKGFTLYELTIVLAIIAIVGTLVVSFVTFLTKYSNTVKQDNTAMTEIYTYKVMVEKWFSHFDTAEYKFKTLNDSNNIDMVIGLTAYDGSTEYSVSYSESGYITLQYEKDSGYGTLNATTGINELQIVASSVNKLTFTNYDGTSATDDLWRCTVGCDSGDVTFLLERHVGYSSQQI